MPEIYKLIADDPEEGARALLAEYGERLYATAYRLCLNEADAEDLAFRTMARAIERNSSFKGESRYFTWLCAIMINFMKMDARRKGANSLVFSEEQTEGEDARPNPAESVEMADEHARIRRAVESLPDSLRIPVVLFYFDRMGVGEIAERLGAPEGTVYYRLHEARKAIKNKLVQEYHTSQHQR